MKVYIYPPERDICILNNNSNLFSYFSPEVYYFSPQVDSFSALGFTPKFIILVPRFYWATAPFQVPAYRQILVAHA